VNAAAWPPEEPTLRRVEEPEVTRMSPQAIGWLLTSSATAPAVSAESVVSMTVVPLKATEIWLPLKVRRRVWTVLDAIVPTDA